MKKSGAFLLICIIESVAAQPEVIADFGGRPTDFPKINEVKPALNKKRSLITTIKPVDKQNHFPMWSALTLGFVDSRLHKQRIQIPVFIIGVDKLSIEWLIENKNYFHDISARGIVTNVATQKDLDAVRAKAPGLVLDALPVDEIATLYGIEHYPALIDKEEIKQ